MTDTKHQLINARRACELLADYAAGRENTFLLLNSEVEREAIAALIAQFKRLDKKEDWQRKAGKKGAIHGSKGGRPKKVTKNA